MANPLRTEATAAKPKRSQQEICADWNARRERDDVHWYIHEGQIKIGWERQLGIDCPQPSHIMERDRKTFGIEDWAELNAYLEAMGSTVRYRADGERVAA